MKISSSKTEYLCVNEGEGNDKIAMEVTEINKVNEFKYLGLGVNSEGGCTRNESKLAGMGGERCQGCSVTETCR